MNHPAVLDVGAAKKALRRTLSRLEKAGELEKPGPEEDEEEEHPALQTLRSLQRLDAGEAEGVTLRWLALPRLDLKLHCALLISLENADSAAALEVLLEHLLRLNTTFDERRDWATNAAEWNRAQDHLSRLHNAADEALRKLRHPQLLIRLRQELRRTREDVARLTPAPSPGPPPLRGTAPPSPYPYESDAY